MVLIIPLPNVSHSKLTLRSYMIIVSILPGSFFVVACDQKGPDVEVNQMNQTDIVAGPGEQSITQKYGVDIRLPMPEADFLLLLNQLKLSYDLCGERGTRSAIPLPRWKTSIDLSSVNRCYNIVGHVDVVHHTGERYRAFVNGHQQVIYIENIYSYTGP
jgi:hypothetical protein